jgi:hypothetical protein
MRRHRRGSQGSRESQIFISDQRPRLNEAGATGEDCTLKSDACGSCVVSRCASDVEACAGDASCPGGLSELQTCACADQHIENCLGDFSSHGRLAMNLTQCLLSQCGVLCGS